MGFIKIKNICSSNGTVKKTKMHARYYKKLSNGNIYSRDGLHPEYAHILKN